MVATSLLNDVTVGIAISTTGDTGVPNTTWTGSFTLNCDKVSVKETLTTSDHSGGQDAWEMHRSTKGSWQVDVECKLASSVSASLRSKLILGKQIQMIAQVSLGTLGDTAAGILTDVEHEYAGPSTLKFTIKPYGSGILAA